MCIHERLPSCCPAHAFTLQGKPRNGTHADIVNQHINAEVHVYTMHQIRTHASNLLMHRRVAKTPYCPSAATSKYWQQIALTYCQTLWQTKGMKVEQARYLRQYMAIRTDSSLHVSTLTQMPVVSHIDGVSNQLSHIRGQRYTLRTVKKSCSSIISTEAL